MISSLLRSAAALLAALSFGAHAQAPTVLGEPSKAPKAAATAKLRLDVAAAAPRVELPPPGEGELERVREANRRSAADVKRGHARRIAIGMTRPLEGAPMSRPQVVWREVPGGRAAHLQVSSPDALALRTAIDLTEMPLEVQMSFTGSEGGGRVEGPVRVADIADRTAPWWSPITEGSVQTIEFFAPGDVEVPAIAKRAVSVSHILTTPSSGFAKRMQDIGLAGACNIDVPCSPLNNSAAFQNVAESVAQMVFTDGSLTGLCTGTLLNDSDPNTQVPYFYSANHCFENERAPFKTPAQMQTVANSLTTLWGFQANTCGSLTPRANWTQISGGAAFLHNDPQADSLLVRLNGTPPSYAFFSGWDANAVAAGTAVITVHHPEGDLKKASQGSVLGFQTLSDVGPGGGSFIEVLWSSGTTEPGSSGAGLWSSTATPGGAQYLFRGGLWGGTALCTNRSGTDNFSRFDRVYPVIAPFLGTSAPAFGPSNDYTDLWWGGASQDGWGLNLVQHPSKVIFGVWYTYDSAGKRTWFVFSDGSWTAQDNYEATLLAVTGPSQTGTFDQSLVRRNAVGTVTLTFTSASTATFRWSVGGDSGVRSISRFAF